MGAQLPKGSVQSQIPVAGAAVPAFDVVWHPNNEPLPEFVQSDLVVKKASQPLVMGVSFGLAVARQQPNVVFELVKIDCLFNEASAAYNEQIIKQGRGQMLV